ncbi:MAG: NAD-dependent epimerase/dehydratase family protein [Patescibacteria group bacterium]
MKKILVTGASGLIGKAVVRNLLRRDRYVILATDLKKTQSFFQVNSPNFSFIQGDLRDYKFVDDLVSKTNGVIHLAAPSSFLMYKGNPRESTINTIQSFLNILEAMKKHGIKKIVHASTSAVYEGNKLPYHEDMVINPPDLKALSKKVNEEIGNQYDASCGIKSVAMRPFSVYGEEEDTKGGCANVTSLFAWAMVSGKRPVVWGDGNQTRDLIYVDDAAEMFCLALGKDISSQPLNVGTGVETSFNKIIQLINEELETNLKPIYVSVPIDIYARRLLSDNSRVEKVLGFKPKVSVEEGIKRIVASAKKIIKEHPEMAEKQMYFKTLKKDFA